jgi:hypothetical protein
MVSFLGFTAVTYVFVESFAGMLPAIKITGPSHIDVHGLFFVVLCHGINF